MRLREALNRLSSETVERMSTANAWKRCGTAWPEAALRPAGLAEAASRLSSWGRRLLNYWVRSAGPLPVQEESLMNHSVSEAGLAGAEMRAAIQELCACGILFAVRKSWGERLLFMPADCYTAWRLALAGEDVWTELLASCHDAPANEAAFRRPEQAGAPALEMAPPASAPGAPLARRLLRAYAALHRIGLTRTVQGAFPKKTVDAVAQLLALPRSGPMERLRLVHEDAYPVSFALALDIALKLGLLVFRDGDYRWSDTELDDWLSGNERVREAEMAQLVTMLYGCRSSREAFVAVGLLALEPNRLYRASAGLSGFLADWLQFMHSCGWAQYEMNANGGGTFRWLLDPRLGCSDTPESSDAEPIIVLPDGELIVPPSASFAVRWKLEQMTRWVRDDVVAIYRVTSDSVASAAERGIRSDDLLKTLESAGGGVPLPDELVNAVRHWSAGACRTSIEDVVLLRCEAKEIADAIAERPELRALLGERLGDRAFIVRADEAARLRKGLERAGFPPLRQSEVSSASGKRRQAVRQSEALAPPSFIYNEHAVDRFELLAPASFEPDGPAIEPLPADWPASWTGQLRSYHQSTRKQIIESALERGMPVQLIAGGQSVELLPQRLETAAEPWRVSGYIRKAAAFEPVCLSPDMWEEMRIVIPRLAPGTDGL